MNKAYPDAQKNTDLHQAAADGDLKLAQELLAGGAKIDLQDEYGSRPLSKAVFKGHLAMVEFLISRGAKVDDMMLYTASRVDQLEIARVLIAEGADVNVGQPSKYRALHVARSRGMAELLLENGADLHALTRTGVSPLQATSETCNLELVRLFLEKGSPVDGRNKRGETTLHTVCEKCRQVAIVKLLLEEGADPMSASNSRELPVHKAVMSDHLEIVGFLLEQVDAEKVDSNAHNSMAHAALFHSIEMLMLLAEKGADLDLPNHEGYTPLHVAARSNDLEAAGLLLTNGARVDARAKLEKTALHLSLEMLFMNAPIGCEPFEHDQLEMVELLVEHQADINAVDNHLWNSLHFAVKSRQLPSALFLAARGVDLKAQDKSGRTPLDYVKDPEVRKQIEEAAGR